MIKKCPCGLSPNSSDVGGKVDVRQVLATFCIVKLVTSSPCATLCVRLTNLWLEVYYGSY